MKSIKPKKFMFSLVIKELQGGAREEQLQQDSSLGGFFHQMVII
jgi:hypothetical protein